MRSFYVSPKTYAKGYKSKPAGVEYSNDRVTDVLKVLLSKYIKVNIIRTMSLLPLLGDHLPERLLYQNFGLALTPEDLLAAAVPPILSKNYYRPWRQVMVAKDFGSTIKSDKEKLQINLDVQHFAPEEITVKTCDGNVVIEGKHEEKEDGHSYISRQFTRRYALPQDCNPESVTSSLSSDGVLTVVAPRTSPHSKNVRSVPITQTGPVKKEIKDSAKAEENGPASAQ